MNSNIDYRGYISDSENVKLCGHSEICVAHAQNMSEWAWPSRNHTYILFVFSKKMVEHGQAAFNPLFLNYGRSCSRWIL